MISESTYLALFATLSEAELMVIRDQTMLVATGHSISVSANGQTIAWDKVSADRCLRLVLQALERIRAGDEGATSAITMAKTLGHPVRFHNRVICGA